MVVVVVGMGVLLIEEEEAMLVGDARDRVEREEILDDVEAAVHGRQLQTTETIARIEHVRIDVLLLEQMFDQCQVALVG